MLIGFQPETAQSLLADGAAGTPQRFLWMSGYDRTLPDADYDKVPPFLLPIELPDGTPIKGVITGPDWLAKDLKNRRRRMLRAEEFVAQLDSHEVAMRCKLAALLALIDERMVVNDDDWRLAGVMWDTSAAIRDQLTDLGQREARKQAEQKKIAAVDVAVTAHAQVKNHDANVERVARRMQRRRLELGAVKQRDLRHETASRDRMYHDEALMFAVNRGWLEVRDGMVFAGQSQAA